MNVYGILYALLLWMLHVLYFPITKARLTGQQLLQLPFDVKKFFCFPIEFIFMKAHGRGRPC